MVTPIDPGEAEDYAEPIRAFGARRLFREGFRYNTPHGSPSRRDWIPAAVSKDLVECLSDSAVALLGKGGIFQLALHLIAVEGERVDVAEETEESLRKSIAMVVLADDPAYVEEALGEAGVLRDS